jgi:hypothetical protein
VTYGGARWGLPFLVRRSLLRGLAPSVPLPLGRPRLKTHFDIDAVLANWDARRSRPLELAAWQYALPGPWAQADDPAGADTTASIRDALDAGDRDTARTLAEARLRALISLHDGWPRVTSGAPREPVKSGTRQHSRHPTRRAGIGLEERGGMPKMTVTTNDGRFVADFEIGDLDPVDYQPEIDEVCARPSSWKGRRSRGGFSATTSAWDPLDLNNGARGDGPPMGERSWARLTIGGTVSRSALAGTLERLEGLRLETCLKDDHVVVEDPEASWGGFSELEAWLQARGIPFDLESAACPGTWPDMLIHFRPGRGRVEYVSDDSHAEPVIPRSALRTALSRCRTQRGLCAWLARTYPEVPALPPIRWARAQKPDDE